MQQRNLRHEQTSWVEEQVKMKTWKMGGVWGLIFILALLMLLAESEAIWSGKNQQPATTGEAAKEYAKEAVRNTADAASNAGESIKQTANAAYETTANAAKTVTGGRKDHASEGPTGAAYRDRAGNYVSDTASATQRRAVDAAGTVKDTAASTAQAARDTAARAYDTTADTVGSARDRVLGAPEPEPTYAQRAADTARRASQNARDGASTAYDTTTNTLGASVRSEDNRGVYEKAKDTISRGGQATRDSTYKAVGYEVPSERGYASRAYDSVRDSSADAYEAGKTRLGSIVEILGWHRVPEEKHTSSLGKYSPYDVIVGNTRYVWHQDPEPDSYYKTAKHKVEGATQTVSEKASQGANTVYDAAGRTKDMTVEGASRASESVKDMAGKTGETVSEYSQKGRETLSAGATAVGVDQWAKDGFFTRIWRFLHLLTWGITLGSAAWMTFMSGRILAQSMPREQFRTVQTKIFPFYLRFLTAGEGALLFLYSFMSNSSKWQILNLLFLVGATAYNAYVLEPQTTKIYLDRLRLEKEEGKGLNPSDNSSEQLGQKNQKFKELHGYSATLNLLSLVGLTYHAWNIVSRLHA